MKKAFTDLEETVHSYLNSLRFAQNKTKSKFEKDKRKADIVSYSYGLENKTYLREEISLLVDMTIERVRQVNKECLIDLRKQIFEPEKSSLFGENYDSIIKLKDELVNLKVISYNSLLSKISLELNDGNIKILLNLLIDIFEFGFYKIHLHLLKDNELIITSKEIDKNIFLQICYATYIVVEKKHSTNRIE